MSDVVKQFGEWLASEPEQTEVIIIRRRGGKFHVRVEYGDRGAIPTAAADLRDALEAAVMKATRMPSSARVRQDAAIRAGQSLPGIAKRTESYPKGMAEFDVHSEERETMVQKKPLLPGVKSTMVHKLPGLG